MSAQQAAILEAIANSVDLIIYVKDAEGRYLYINRYAAGLVDMTPDEIVGKTAYDLLPADRADMLTAVEKRVRETGTPVTIRHTTTLPTGPMDELDHKFPIDLPGHPGATCGIAFDRSILDTPAS